MLIWSGYYKRFICSKCKRRYDTETIRQYAKEGGKYCPLCREKANYKKALKLIDSGDKEKYALVHTHRGIGIYTLKVANLSLGDELGYRIDCNELEDKVFNDVAVAVEAIEGEQDGD